MVRRLTFTRYPHARANVNGSVCTYTWTEWCELFSRHALRGTIADTDNKGALDKAKDGPALVFGEIPADKGRKGANVRFVDALSLDLEKMPIEQLTAVLDLLEPFAFAAWTTHKSGSVVADGEMRLRVVLPLARSLSPSEFPGAWAGLNRFIGYKNDPATKDIGRLNYLPSTFDQSMAFAWSHEGRWLDLTDLPDAEKTKTYDVDDTGVDRHMVMRMKDWLNAERGLPKSARRLAKGEAIAAADSGERHDQILYLTMRLAGKFPNANCDTIEALFAKSIDAMLEEDSSFEGMPSVTAAFDGAVAHAEKTEEAEAAKEEQAIKDFQYGQDEPYADEQLEQACATLKCTRQQLEKRWIILHDQHVWFLHGDGHYRGPMKVKDAEIAVVQQLKRAPVRIVDATKDGFKYRSFNDIMRDYSTVASRLVPTMVMQNHWYDAELNVMYEATCPRRKLTPHFDDRIDIWLRKLANVSGGKLIDWIACAPDTSKLLCSIYFDGPPGAGKTLLAHGLAALWNEIGQPTDVAALVNGFTEEIQRCPLLFGDEDLPTARDRKSITGILRAHLSTHSRTLSRKFRDTAKMMGAIRLILAANNETLLHTDDVATSADLEAIAQRFMYIKADDDAVRYLYSLPRETKDMWMREGIARHALWLMENHVVENPGKRFWVEGDISAMHRVLMTGSRWNSRVCELLVRYLLNPKMGDTKSMGLIRRSDKQLLVNTQFMIDNWQGYLGETEKPDTQKIGAATRAIAASARRISRSFRGKTVNYYEIDIDHLLAWSDKTNIGHRDQILSALGYPETTSTHTDDLNSIPSLNDERDPQ